VDACRFVLYIARAATRTSASNGDKIIFHDYKGYESEWRKHHTSSVTRDIWVYDTRTKKYTQRLAFKGEDRNPVFRFERQRVLLPQRAERIIQRLQEQSRASGQVCRGHEVHKHPVRFCPRSKNGDVAFSYTASLYTMKAASRRSFGPRRGRRSRSDRADRSGQPGFHSSEAGTERKEFAFVFRGEIFVSSIDGKMVKRITNTPWQERTVSWSPDGKSLVYAAEKDNNWNVYTASITRKTGSRTSTRRPW
jgi:Tol biopolymer transport system component